MFRSVAVRRLPKPVGVLLSLLLALYFVPFSAMPAGAVDVGGFQIEGNLLDEGAGIDWESIGPGTAGFATGIDNINASGQDTTTFQGSSKEYVDSGKNGGWPGWTFGSGNAAGKSDFGRWATYSTVQTVGSSSHVFLYLGFDRGSGTGTAKYVFELNQLMQATSTNPNPKRSQGDVRLVVWDQGNGVLTLTGDSQNDDVGLYFWDDPDQGTGGVAEDTDRDGDWVKSSNTGIFAGASNTGPAPISVPAWWTSHNLTAGKLATDQFAEFGIDLSSFGAVVGCPSAGFAAANGRSITGTGGPGTLVDYLEAMAVDIPANCASLQINKFGPGQERLGGATFRISPNPLPVGTPGRPDAGHIDIFDDSNANTDAAPGTYDDPDSRAGYIVLPAVVPDIQYTITEITPPDGYIGETAGKTVTPAAYGDGAVSFTNSLGSVTFTKTYAGGGNQSGATFLLERDGSDADSAYDDGSVTVQDNDGDKDLAAAMGTIKVAGLQTGAWRITETSAPTGWIADGDTVTFTIPGANNSADVVLANPTFENPRQTYPLTVKKVAADDGAVVPGAEFALYQESGAAAGPQLPGSPNADILVGGCTTAANGTCTVTGLAWGKQYYWYEVSVPAPYNLPDNRFIGPVTLNAGGSTDPAGPATIADPETVITTVAANGSLPNATISDVATLSGVTSNAGGTITFRVWGPTSTASCTGTPNATVVVPVSGPGSYSSGPVPVTQAGKYWWTATYSGDPTTGNRGAAGACGDPGETSTVVPANPGITTVVPNSTVTLGATPTQLTDKAILSGATTTASGTISFQLFGPFATDPGADDCATGPVVGVVEKAVAGNGEYVSPPLTVTQTGYYTWVAVYSGDANNARATHACGQAAETVLINPSQPVISTDAQQDQMALSASPTQLSDQATLSGATADAVGAISFQLYGPFDVQPSGSSCTAGKAVGSPVGTVGAFAGNGTYSSLPVTVTAAGYYTWVATYDSSNGKNLDATHACGQLVETTLVNPAAPTITTTAGVDQVVGVNGNDLSDLATISGATTNATGTVTYKLYGPMASDPTGNTAVCTIERLVDTVTNDAVSGNGNYVSPSVHTSSAGYYVWVATYSGDANNLPAAHPCGDASEVVQITPRPTTITTEVPSTTATLGANGVDLHDTATLTGATATAGGAISFQLYGPFTVNPGPDDCIVANKVGSAVGTTAPVVGNATYTSADVHVSQAGFYTWKATYSGDFNNLGATHACGLASETVEVQKNPTTVTTNVSSATVTLNPTAQLVDTATLSGASVQPPATGTITFSLYGPFTSQPGTDDCTPANHVTDVSATAPVNGPATYTSQPVTVNEAGYYVWTAAYSGDANNEASSHACGDVKETTLVQKAQAAISTQVPDGNPQLAPTVDLFDTATLTGVTTDPAATGTITFTLYGPFDSVEDITCAPADQVGSPVGATTTISGPATYTSESIEVGVAGYYTWKAHYSGDANNTSADHACGLAAETVHVARADSSITTDAVDRVALSSGPTTITDTATLTDVTEDPAATGTITFNVYGPFTSQPAEGSLVCAPADLAGTTTATEAVDGPGTYVSGAVTVKRAGYYVWVADYSGDSNNEPATHPCGQTAETTVVDKASPAISTQVAATDVNLPDAVLMDTATLSGATSDPAAGGEITFRLYGPFEVKPTANSCVEGALVDTGDTDMTVPVSGNGSYASPGVTVHDAGWYTWVASYSGDDNNQAATHACGLETETVQVHKAPSETATQATPRAVIKLGNTISDQAVVTGLTDDATGTVTFALHGPADPEGEPDCSGTPVFTSTVDLVVSSGDGGASGSAVSAAFTPTAPGLYQWIASYSGDANNAASAGACGDDNEQSLVFAGDSPGLDKTSDPESGSVVQPGTVIDYTVTVRNTGDVAISEGDVVDILPPHVTVDETTISDGGTLNAGGTEISWTVNLAPGAEKALTYTATVDDDAPEGSVLVNTATFFDLEDTTTHVVPTGDLTIVKAVTPVAGNGVVIHFGDTLTYTLTAFASGTLDQPSVEVTDYVPGSDPARPTSGRTTYVPGSAACVGAGDCTVTQPGADGLITWKLGDMAAGTSRQVTFKVTIDRPAALPNGAIPAVDVLNAGAVESTRTPLTPSNEVITPVTEVLGVKVPAPPTGVLPRTGALVPPAQLAGVAVLLFGLGLLLVSATRQRGRHRRT